MLRMLKGLEKLKGKTAERGAIIPSYWVPTLLSLDPKLLSAPLEDICLCLLA